MKLSDLSDTALAGLMQRTMDDTDGAIMRSLLICGGYDHVSDVRDSVWFGLVAETAAIRASERGYAQ